MEKYDGKISALNFDDSVIRAVYDNCGDYNSMTIRNHNNEKYQAHLAPRPKNKTIHTLDGDNIVIVRKHDSNEFLVVV